MAADRKTKQMNQHLRGVRGMSVYKWARVFSAGMLLLSIAGVSQAATLPAIASDVIEAAGPAGNADFYAQGNDDGFAEYSIATFQFTAADFGGAVPASAAGPGTLDLTVNDRFFSNPGGFDLLYTPDDLSGLSLTFDASGGNDPGGVDPSQFTTAPVAVGSGVYPFMGSTNGGDVLTFAVDFTGTNIVSEITAGSEFQILLVANELATAATFSGVGNTFDPGDPTLTIVPEPSAIAGLLIGLFALGLRRR
jgi:hypothetical protein